MNQVIEYHFPLMFTSALTKLSFFGGKECFGLKIKSISKLHLSVQVNLLILGVCVCVCVCVCGHSVYPTLCNPLDCSPPGSSVHGILQVRILEWVTMRSSRESSQPRDRTRISYVFCIGRRILYH